MDRRLDEVPVDGEAVVGIVLEAAAHRLPLGEDPHEQAVLVERLARGDRPETRGQQLDEGAPARVRPPGCRHRGARPETHEAGTIDRCSRGGCGGRDPERE